MFPAGSASEGHSMVRAAQHAEGRPASRAVLLLRGAIVWTPLLLIGVPPRAHRLAVRGPRDHRQHRSYEHRPANPEVHAPAARDAAVSPDPPFGGCEGRQLELRCDAADLGHDLRHARRPSHDQGPRRASRETRYRIVGSRSSRRPCAASKRPQNRIGRRLALHRPEQVRERSTHFDLARQTAQSK